MRRLWVGLLLGVGCLAVAAEARALVVMRPGGPDRVVQAQLVVVGTVQSIEERDLDLPFAPSSPATAKYKVAVVQVREVLKGAERLQTVRVAFQPAPAVNPKIIKRPFPRNPDLKAGQEALLFLNKHFKEPVYQAVGMPGVVLRDPNGQAFTNEITQVKHKVRLLANPLQGLRSQMVADRVQTAALLLGMYRGTFSKQTEPINADESKLILMAVAEANWQGSALDPLNGRTLFNQLGVTPKDGWTPPQNFQDFPAAAQQWLRQNAGTFRIQRYVPVAAPAQR
jgi:hypothetical protein